MPVRPKARISKRKNKGLFYLKQGEESTGEGRKTMGSKRMVSVLIFGVVFLAVVLTVFFFWTRSQQEIKEFPLPPVSQTPSMPDDTGPDKANEENRVTVNKNTVQAVIRELSRPKVYSRDIVIESYWDGGSIIYNIKSSFAENASAFEITGVGDTQRIIITDKVYYVWYQGDHEPFSASNEDEEDYNKYLDKFQMLITYEDVIKLPLESILEADYTSYDGELCIYVKYASGSLGYVTSCYVSLKNGLLIAAEEYDGDKLVYEMTSLPCGEGEINEKLFVLPDGESVIAP